MGVAYKSVWFTLLIEKLAEHALVTDSWLGLAVQKEWV